MVEGEIVVFAASSLTESFEALGREFRKANPRAALRFSFGSSSALAVQINEGAPADVFASANRAQMEVAAGKGNVDGSRIFATNVLVIVVAKGFTRLQSFQDLARPGVKLVLAARDVPIGQYARESLIRAATSGAYGPGFDGAVLANVRSEEPNVRSVLAKVQLGEADAAIVYATDAAVAASGIRTVEVPAAYNVIAEYPIAVVKGSKRPLTARAFVDFTLSQSGQSVLRTFGFGPPP